MRKTLSLLVVVALLMGVVAGATTSAATTIEIRWNNGAEPQTIDPALSTGIPEANTILQVFEGLTRLDKGNNPIPAIARSWTIAADKKTYLFTLRDSYWTNGMPVTAYDFEYAWKRALQPETASEYAYQLYYIYGGEAFNTSINVNGKYYRPKLDAQGNPVTKKEGDKEVPVADMTKEIDPSKNVGVRALNAKTLKVYLASPTAYFLSLCAFPTLMPVCKAVVSKNADWTKDDLKAYVTNGAFKIVTWSHSEKMEFVKNPSYWDKASVRPDKLTYYMIDNESTALAQYQSGELDGSDTVPLAELPALVKSGDAKIMPYLGTYYYMFNVTKKPFNDARVRQALTLAIDREAIVTNVTRGGQLPAFAFVPYGIPDAIASVEFRKARTEAYYKDADITKAKALLAAAGYPDGKNFPSFTLLYNTSNAHKSIGEAIQQMWKKNLGISCVLKNTEWGIYLDDRSQLNYQVARAGWIGDYVDANTFLDMWVTGGGNNDTGWSNKQYDALIAKAKATPNARLRVQYMHDAEDILMKEMPISPIYYYTHPVLVSPKLRNFQLSTLGFVDWKNAYLAP